MERRRPKHGHVPLVSRCLFSSFIGISRLEVARQGAVYL